MDNLLGVLVGIPVIILLITLIAVIKRVSVGYQSSPFQMGNEKLLPKGKVIVMLILFTSLLASDVIYGLIIYLQLQQQGITLVDRNIVGTFIGGITLAITLKGFYGYYIFDKIPYTRQQLEQKDDKFINWLKNTGSKSTQYEGKLLSFLILGIAILELPAILGLIDILQKLAQN